MAADIRRALVTMAVSRAGQIDDATQVIYVNGLSDLEPEHVIAACQALSLEERKDGETALPSLGMIRRWAKKAALHARVSQKLIASDDPTYRCHLCQDAGWTIHVCLGGRQRTCLRLDYARTVWDEAAKHAYFYGSCQVKHDYAVRCAHAR